MRLNLAEQEIFFITGDARKISIRCETGTLWVTQPNDRKDYILDPGDSFNATSRGKVVVAAVTDSIVTFSNPASYSNTPITTGFNSNPVIKFG